MGCGVDGTWPGFSLPTWPVLLVFICKAAWSSSWGKLKPCLVLLLSVTCPVSFTSASPCVHLATQPRLLTSFAPCMHLLETPTELAFIGGPDSGKVNVKLASHLHVLVGGGVAAMCMSIDIHPSLHCLRVRIFCKHAGKHLGVWGCAVPAQQSWRVRSGMAAQDPQAASWLFSPASSSWGCARRLGAGCGLSCGVQGAGLVYPP